MSPFGVNCPKCNAGMPMGVAFCGKCGARIESEPSPPPAAESGAPKSVGSRLLMVAWALGIAAGFFLGRAFAPGTPAGPANGSSAVTQPLEGNPADQLAAARTASDGGRYAEARDLYLRALDSAPQDLSARVDLGIAQLALGDEEAARASFAEALAAPSPHPAAAYNLAKLAEEAGNRPEAAKYYALYLKLAPGGPRAEEVHSKLAGGALPGPSK